MGFSFVETDDEMERIVCPKCGEEIGTVGVLRAMAASQAEQEFWGYCGCKQKYRIRLSFLNSLILSFPDRNTVMLC